MLGLALLAASTYAQSRPSGDRQGRRPQRAPVELKSFDFDVRTFESPSLKRASQYGVFLPKGYSDAANKDKRYPVVVWLHGLWENHTRFHERGESGALDQAAGAGLIPELIFVTPNGGNSFYLNGKESGAYEDLIAKDLLPELEKSLRIAKQREQRVLMGNSMGGGGALRIALKHPELFGTVATHSAALFPIDPEEIDQRFRQTLYGEGPTGFGLSKIFGVPPDLEMWRRENPLWIAGQLDADKLEGLKIYFDCGEQDRFKFFPMNAALHDVLAKRKIKHTWRPTQGNHGTAYAIANLPESLRFVGMALGTNAAKAGLEGMLDGANGKSGDGTDGKRPEKPASQKSSGK